MIQRAREQRGDKAADLQQQLEEAKAAVQQRWVETTTELMEMEAEVARLQQEQLEQELMERKRKETERRHRAEERALQASPSVRLELRQRPVAEADPKRPKGGRPPTSGHPFPERCNVRQWAEEHGYSWGLCKRWYSRGKYGRPVPRAVARLLLRTHGIPMLSWPNGISDDKRLGKLRGRK